MELLLIHNKLHLVGPCRLTLELVSEEVPTAELSSLYPFNALRNHALLLVKTEVGAVKKAKEKKRNGCTFWRHL